MNKKIVLVSVISALFSVNAANVVAKELASKNTPDQLSVQLPTKQDSRLEEVASSSHVWNGVTVSNTGRVFVTLTQSEGAGIQVAEISKDGKLQPYPDATWNEWQQGADPQQHFLHVNAARIGPDGKLWVVDAGNTGIGTGAKAVVGASKLVRIDLVTNKVDKVVSFKAPIQGTYSYFDDVRFNGDYAYITDPGEKALVVVNLQNGQAWRVLENHLLSIDHLPIYADGSKLYLANGTEKRVGLDQLEVSPDGQYLYYQPVPGPMARIETQYLNDPTLAQEVVAKQAKLWLTTWSTGGTAIDSDGNIYSSDVNNRSIKRISPAGEVTTIIADPRLIWVDAMWIQGGYLWMPAGQINRTPAANGGKASRVEYPVHLYRVKLAIKASPLDHGE